MLAAVALFGVSPVCAEDYTPSCERIRAGLERPAHASVFPAEKAVKGVVSARASQAVAQPVRSGRKDSVWDGALIGAAAGAGGGYLWARNICGANDAECFAIAGPVGVLSGAGIGAAVGAIVDALHR